eukprot:2664594-Prymnesium_polylepis.1
MTSPAVPTSDFGRTGRNETHAWTRPMVHAMAPPRAPSLAFSTFVDPLARGGARPRLTNSPKWYYLRTVKLCQ